MAVSTLADQLAALFHASNTFLLASSAPFLTSDYKSVVLVISCLIHVWETYLAYRQHHRLAHTLTIPPRLQGTVKPDEFAKARAYGLDKSRFAMISANFNQFLSLAIIVLDVLPWYWSKAGQAVIRLGVPGEISQSLAFAAILFVQSTITGLPFGLYSTFVIEHRHGFNKQTLAIYFADMVKGALLTFIIGGPVLAAFIRIIQWAGEFFYWYVWAFLFVFQILMLIIYPTVIQPMFNTFTPLPEGELRTKIEALASRISFPLTKLFVVDGSRRSGHSNAYFYGFFNNKRIVLFDTLLEQADTEEVCGVLAHELGHWKMNHVFKMLAINQVHLFILFYTFGFFIHRQALYDSFGFTTSQPIFIGFMLFQYILTPVESIMGFLMNLLSRLHEFQADAYAVRLGYSSALASGLIKIHVKNLGNLVPDRLYSLWHYSHPPLVERLDAIAVVNGRIGGAVKGGSKKKASKSE